MARVTIVLEDVENGIGFTASADLPPIDEILETGTNAQLMAANIMIGLKLYADGQKGISACVCGDNLGLYAGNN